MALPSSGPLTFSAIQTEFGGSNPIGLNEYYAGGANVPAGTSGTYGAVPSSGQISVQNFYGTSDFIPQYIEEVFQTWLYTGNGSSQTITNGINLSGNGGLVWIKCRQDGSTVHSLFDTQRGVRKRLATSLTSAEFTYPSTGVTAFGSTGFSVADDSAGSDNVNGAPGGTYAGNGTYVSWTFRKQSKFFDVVTYTGTGAGQNIAHNLGSTPGCIIVKSSSNALEWYVWHRGLTSSTQSYIFLNRTDAATTSAAVWNNTAPTSTQFSVGATSATNGSGNTYVAYVFAHDAGGFGSTGTDNVISCGSYTGNGTADTLVTLGYEPQWVLVKNSSGSPNDWFILDNMRGYAYSSQAYLRPNLSDAEGTSTTYHVPSATGFTLLGTGNPFNNSGTTYIYIAIRRGPMKVPTDATKVFSQIAATVATNTAVTTNFPVDMVYGLVRPGGDHNLMDRLRGISNTSAVSPYLKTESTSAEVTANNIYNADNQTGYKFGSYFSGASSIFYSFRRAPSFFDEVCYTGTGSGRTLAHNLGVVPELMIVKIRNISGGWGVYTAAYGPTYYLVLNTTAAVAGPGVTLWNSTAPTSSVFSVGTAAFTNTNGNIYVAYLFATCPGVSKVGSYTGTGGTQTIACGFTGGARFVLIKRTDSTGDWYVWDTARGMVSGTDPSLLLNSTTAEVNANSVYTIATGFQIVSTAAGINASGGTYIFLAVA
jgi:hypothetical protein